MGKTPQHDVLPEMIEMILRFLKDEEIMCHESEKNEHGMRWM